MKTELLKILITKSVVGGKCLNPQKLHLKPCPHTKILLQKKLCGVYPFVLKSQPNRKAIVFFLP